MGRDLREQRLLVERFRERVDGAKRDGFGAIDRRRGGVEKDDRKVRELLALLQLRTDGVPVHLRHVDVEQEEVGARDRDDAQRGFAALRQHHLVAGLREQHVGDRQRVTVVVDDEDDRRRAGERLRSGAFDAHR